MWLLAAARPIAGEETSFSKAWRKFFRVAQWVFVPFGVYIAYTGFETMQSWSRSPDTFKRHIIEISILLLIAPFPISVCLRMVPKQYRWIAACGLWLAVECWGFILYKRGLDLDLGLVSALGLVFFFTGHFIVYLIAYGIPAVGWWFQAHRTILSKFFVAVVAPLAYLVSLKAAYEAERQSINRWTGAYEVIDLEQSIQAISPPKFGFWPTDPDKARQLLRDRFQDKTLYLTYSFKESEGLVIFGDRRARADGMVRGWWSFENEDLSQIVIAEEFPAVSGGGFGYNYWAHARLNNDLLELELPWEVKQRPKFYLRKISPKP